MLEATVTQATTSARAYAMLVAVLIGLALLPAGCSTTPSDSVGDFQGAVYIEGFLIAGHGVDSVFVGSTVPLYESYSRATSGIAGALVTIQVDGVASVLDALANKPGYYHLPQLLIQSGKTYHLTVSIEDVTVQAQTIVPAPPTISTSSAALTLAVDQLTVTWTGDTQGGYVTTRSPIVLEEPIPLESIYGVAVQSDEQAQRELFRLGLQGISVDIPIYVVPEFFDRTTLSRLIQNGTRVTETLYFNGGHHGR